MSELMPGTLREFLDNNLAPEQLLARIEGKAHASAWEADRKRLEEAQDALKELEQEFAIDHAQMQACIEALEKALSEIAKGEGRFSRDPLIHASNTVEDMKALAVAALAAEKKT